ncbi:MAG: hypothetical protein WBD47_12075 [Phormidesmis sp.]
MLDWDRRSLDLSSWIVVSGKRSLVPVQWIVVFGKRSLVPG